jgi:phenylacetate-CoA ligase
MWNVGRKSDEIVVDGRSILPRELWQPVERVDACALGLFQVVRPAREVDRLCVRVGYAPGWEARLTEVRDELKDAIHTAVGVEPDVELVPNDALLRLGPPHKIPRVVRA